jgi:type IV pilus assembly protein PilV
MNRQRLSPPTRRARPQAASGFTLLSVLVSIFIMSIGLLGMVRTMLGVTSAATQNQTVSSLAQLSNTFWSVVQWTPQPTVTNNFPGTYDLTSASAISSAPTNLRPWLTAAQTALPNGQAVIAVNNAGCTTNCALTLTLSWTQVGAPGTSGTSAAMTRSQVFYYAL